MTGDPQEPVTDARPSRSAGQRLLGESIQVNWAPAFRAASMEDWKGEGLAGGGSSSNS